MASFKSKANTLSSDVVTWCNLSRQKINTTKWVWFEIPSHTSSQEYRGNRKNSNVHDEIPNSLIIVLEGGKLLWMILVHPLNHKWYWMPRSLPSSPPILPPPPLPLFKICKNRVKSLGLFLIIQKEPDPSKRAVLIFGPNSWETFWNKKNNRYIFWVIIYFVNNFQVFWVQFSSKMMFISIDPQWSDRIFSTPEFFLCAS